MSNYKIHKQGILNWLTWAAMKITGQRVVILHNHIFKNAGTTIDWALEKSFGRTFVDHRDDHQMKQGTSYLGQYLIENRHIKALSSHHLPMPLPSLANARVMMIMMLRHPIERVASVYNFEKNQLKSTTPGAIHARKLNLREYIQWRMQPEVGYTIRNFYTHKLLPHKGRAKDAIGEQEMATVMHSAVAIELLGLVERFDESMVLFEHCLRKFFPRIDLSYKIQNVGQETSGNRLERIESIRTEVGEDIFNLLLENNRRDLDLFASVESEIDRRITKVPDFNEKLISFRARCKRYG